MKKLYFSVCLPEDFLFYDKTLKRQQKFCFNFEDVEGDGCSEYFIIPIKTHDFLKTAATINAYSDVEPDYDFAELDEKKTQLYLMFDENHVYMYILCYIKYPDEKFIQETVNRLIMMGYPEDESVIEAKNLYESYKTEALRTFVKDEPAPVFSLIKLYMQPKRLTKLYDYTFNRFNGFDVDE